VQGFVESELAFKPLNARAIAGTQQLEDVIGRAKAAECFPWRLPYRTILITLFNVPLLSPSPSMSP
jgi:hypothetical protein